MFATGLALPQRKATQGQGMLSGIARDASGKHLPGVTVTARPSWQSIATNEFWRQAETPSAVLGRATTDARGRFAIRVPAGPLYEVTFEKSDFVTRVVRVYANRPFYGQLTRGRNPVTAKAPAPDPKDGGITGKILDKSTGKPIAGASLREPWKHAPLASSKADGSFFVAWGEKHSQELLMVIASGYRVGSIAKEAWRKGHESTADAKLEPGLEIVGRIVDENGDPVANHLVLVDSDIFVSESHSYSGVAWTTRTDSKGIYRVRELAPNGRYWIRSLLPDGTPIELAQGIASTPSRDVGTFRTGPRTSIFGKVTWRPKTVVRDMKGKQHTRNGPVTDGRVHVLRMFDGKIAQWLVARETPHFPVDHTGRYRIPSLCPGRYELGFWAMGAEMEIRVVEATRKGRTIEVDAELGAGRQFNGRVLDPDGKPIDGALIRGMPFAKDEYLPLVPPDNPTNHNGRYLVGNVRVLTRPDGRYQLERIRSHVPIRLTVSKKGFATRKLRIEVGKSPPEEIRLERAR